jgi:hypothetical protein
LSRCRRSYVALISRIEKRFGDFPLSALTDRRTRGVFMAWRDEIASGAGRRQADYAWTVLARVRSWSLNRGLIAANPCERGGRLYRGGGRAEKIWTDADGPRFSNARPRIFICRLRSRSGPDNGRVISCGFHGRPMTGNGFGCGSRRPLGALKSRLARHSKPRSMPHRSAAIILTNTEGKPWTSAGFRASWGKACKTAGIVGVTFHDLRGTAVTRLALAGCTEAEIATTTGLSLRNVRAILDSHYLNRDPALAVSAIRKLEKRTKAPD